MRANMLLIALLGISSPQPNIVNQREPPQICIQKRQQLHSDPKYVFEKIISQSQYTMDDFKGYKRITAGEVEKSDENISLTNFFWLSNIVKPVVVLKGNNGFVVYQTRSGDNVMHEIKKDKESGFWTIISTQTWTGKKIFDMQDCIKKGTKKG